MEDDMEVVLCSCYIGTRNYKMYYNFFFYSIQTKSDNLTNYLRYCSSYIAQRFHKLLLFVSFLQFVRII